MKAIRKQLEVAMQVKLSPSQVQDNGKVRMGMLSPSFPAPQTGKTETADSGKVRMGMLSPTFPAVRIAAAATADNSKAI